MCEPGPRARAHARMPPGSLPLPGLEYRSIPLLPHPTAQSRPAGRAAPPAAATRLASELRPGSAALRPNSPRAASRGLHAPLGRTGQPPSTLMSPTNFGTAAPVHSTAQGAGAAGVHDAPALASSSSPALATGPPASPKASSRGRLNSARGGLAGASTIATSRLLGTGDDDGAKLSARDAEAPAPAAHAPHLWALGLEPGAEPAPAPPAEPTPRTVPGLSVTQGANGGAGSDGGAAAAHACNGGCNGISSEGHGSRVASARPSTPGESKSPPERSAGAPAAAVTPGRPETSRNDSSAESADDVIVIHVRDDNRCAAAPSHSQPRERSRPERGRRAVRVRQTPIAAAFTSQAYQSRLLLLARPAAPPHVLLSELPLGRAKVRGHRHPSPSRRHCTNLR